MGGKAAAETSSSTGWSVSVNWWFEIPPLVGKPRFPFPPHIELELARHVEYFFCDAYGAGSMGRIAAACLTDTADGMVALDDWSLGGEEATLDGRNFVLYNLARL